MQHIVVPGQIRADLSCSGHMQKPGCERESLHIASTNNTSSCRQCHHLANHQHDVCITKPQSLCKESWWPSHSGH